MGPLLFLFSLLHAVSVFADTPLPPLAATFRPTVTGDQQPFGNNINQVVAPREAAGVNNRPSSAVVVPPEPDYGAFVDATPAPSSVAQSLHPSSAATIAPEDYTDFTAAPFSSSQSGGNALSESTPSSSPRPATGSSAQPRQQEFSAFPSDLGSQTWQPAAAFTPTAGGPTDQQPFTDFSSPQPQQQFRQPSEANTAWPQGGETGYSAPSVGLYPAPVPVPPPSQPQPSYGAPAPQPDANYGPLPPSPGYQPSPVQPLYIPGPSPGVYSTLEPPQPTWGPVPTSGFPPAPLETPTPPPSEGYPSQPLGQYNQIAVPQTATYSQAVGGYSYQVNQAPAQQQIANYQIAPDAYNDAYGGGSQPPVAPPPSGYAPSGGGGYGVASVGYSPNPEGFSQAGYGGQQPPTPDYGQGGYANAPVQAGVVGVLGPNGNAVDTSDPCFRRYSNCIIVNAQPYERRSSKSLPECKSHCLSSQTGVYSCRSFVFDTINQVCDLFAHVGNQPPARLLQFQGRDYYEPTGATTGCESTVAADSLLAVPAPGVATATGLNGAATPVDGAPTCEANESTKYLRIEGFQLQENDDLTLPGLTVEQCIEACTKNQGPTGEVAPCQSFDFVKGTCIITLEAGVPLGNGQLTQNANSDYYEKICVPNSSATGCPLVFDRFPQMILVGFAETVVDANTFEQCLDNCLNSQTLYGFRCTSGMFYFEEPQLNCILNTEDRASQPDLFTEENVDIVDYFETGCAASRSRLRNNRVKSARRQFSSRSAVISDVKQVKQGDELSVFVRAAKVKEASKSKSSSTPLPPLGEWTEWSTCDRNKDGRRARHRRCESANLKDCPTETEWCNRESPPRNILSQDALNFAQTYNGTDIDTRKFRCPPNICCPIFGGCRMGIEQMSDGKLRWCTNPCEQDKQKKS
uniref:Apple domain-containing protein n=1 Tax=Plectus sambesii TaxID=2011161 RepID=A0A914W580_9BILA